MVSRRYLVEVVSRVLDELPRMNALRGRCSVAASPPISFAMSAPDDPRCDRRKRTAAAEPDDAADHRSCSNDPCSSDSNKLGKRSDEAAIRA